jgi:hypothetical protein
MKKNSKLQLKTHQMMNFLNKYTYYHNKLLKLIIYVIKNKYKLSNYKINNQNI